MKKAPKYLWFPMEGFASCELFYKDKTFNGTATCCLEDQDFQSEKTGCEIASRRAFIKYLVYTRDNELIPRLNELKQFYYCVKQSKEFDENSYIAKALVRKIKCLEYELKDLRTMIKGEKKNLTNFIADKDKFYKTVRKHREENKDNTK